MKLYIETFFIGLLFGQIWRVGWAQIHGDIRKIAFELCLTVILVIILAIINWRIK